jgi:hypothetical protein
MCAGARADTPPPTSIVPPIEDRSGILYVTVRCVGAPCSGHVVLPQVDEMPTSFSLGAGTSKKLQIYIPGPLHTQVAKMSALTAELTQVVDGVEQTASGSYRLIHMTGSTGGPGPASAPGAQGRNAPTIAVGPATRYQAVHDPRGDARSSFQLPQLFDIVLATAKRQGAAVVLTVVSTSAITQHDGYGNPVAPCVEIPWASAQQYPMFLFGNGQLSGYTQHVWPNMKTSIHGGTISWTVPRTVLAKKGFTKGFRWRATGGCDAHHLADLAPNKGFATFRWVKVG